MYRIAKRWTFAAAHHLPTLPDEHKCRRVHGHNYEVELTIAVHELDEHGFVIDYGDLAPFGTWLREMFDHQDLNERMDLSPTAENLAAAMHHAAIQMFAPTVDRHWGVITVRVSETPNTWAEYDGLA